MNKTSHLIVIILAIALAFAACGGNIKSKKDTKTPTVNDADDPLVIFDEGDSENTDLGDGEDGEDGPKKEAGPPTFFPPRIDDVHVECGKPFNKMITTSGGSDKISWEVKGLPKWANYTPSGDNLSISGKMPFEGCDVETYDVSLKACNSKDACSKNSFKINTQIHGIKITTPLNDTTAVMDAKTTIPTLAAEGGCGKYLFTTTIPKELIGEDEDTIITERDIEFTPKKVGNYTITVKAKDKVFEGREREIANKTGKKEDEIGTDTREFKVIVKEDGFVINAYLIKDNNGTTTTGVQSGPEQPADRSFVVPYDGKMRITISGRGEQYSLTIKSEQLSEINNTLTLNEDKTHEIYFYTDDLAEKVKELNGTPINITITAQNDAGESETLTMKNITFDKDPCADESMNVVLSDESGNERSSFVITRGSTAGSASIYLSVQGGKGPFYWKIPTEMKERVDVETDVKVAPLDSADLTDTTPHVSLNDSWRNYGHLPRQRLRSEPPVDLNDSWRNYASENIPEKRETIKITRDSAYININASLGWNAKRELSEFAQGTSGERIKVYEILNATVMDQGCQKKITHNIPIVVEIPKPSQEKIENVRFAHRTTIKHTFNGSDVSRAQMMFYDTGNNLLGSKSPDKDIAAWCGQTETVERWNWPPLDPITASTKYLTDINHLEIKRVQPRWATDIMYHKVERFYIVGKNWVYFDDNGGKGYYAGIGDNDEDDIRCIPIGGRCPEKPASNNTKDGFTFDPIVNTPQGKWYLRCDPSSDTSIWCGGETIKFDADTDMNACHES